MKYIIMCGGYYRGWEIPRQLIKIQGEPIVSRTIRLLRENGVDDICISANDKRFSMCDVPMIEHENRFVGYSGGSGCWAEAFYPMEEPACYLMGDVVFSPDAIKTIVQTITTEIEFFASSPPFSPLYIKAYAEPFAFKVVNQKRFRKAIDYVITHQDIFKRRPIAWELWQVINKEPVNEINYNNYTVINDYTCDIDKMSDAGKISGVLECTS